MNFISFSRIIKSSKVERSSRIKASSKMIIKGSNRIARNGELKEAFIE